MTTTLYDTLPPSHGTLHHPQRNRFYYGKLLDTLHLQMEQAYGKQLRRLHNQMTLGPGILCGLELSAARGKVVVAPGVAIDGIGREIIVPRPHVVDPRTIRKEDGTETPLGPEGPHVVHLCLEYVECLTDYGPAFVCDCDGDPHGEPGTIRETYRIVVREGLMPEPPRLLDEGCCASLTAGSSSPEPDGDGASMLAELRALVDRCFPCDVTPTAGCVPLASLTISGDDVEIHTERPRHRILGNHQLLDLVLCVARRTKLLAGLDPRGAQMVAQIHPPGIAWGLALSRPDPKDGTRLRLEPGLAFDDLGHPIPVDTAHELDLDDLRNAYKAAPTVVVGGGTAFAPCTRVEALGGIISPSEPLPQGAYLVLLSRRKDTGAPPFEPSLTHLRLPPQLIDTNEDPAQRRGRISAWYFDEYERDLATRWVRMTALHYPVDPSYWRGPGPAGRHESAVPLALVYLDDDNAVSFIDAWIPRRPIAGTSGAAWAANARGAPTPSARIARLHQFQSMLIESVADVPHGPNGNGEYGPSLHQRGFRHLPPWGFLPVRPSDDNPGGDDLPTLLFADFRRVEQAKADAKAWFRDTNVLVTTHVAVHDDDILEEIAKADEKDPVVLSADEKTRRNVQLIDCVLKGLDLEQTDPTRLVILGLLRVIFAELGDLTLDQVIHRRVEAVRLIVPMHPYRRTRPSQTDPPSYHEPFGALASSLPHRWVVFVKQRFVWLDVLYLFVDMWLDMFAVMVGLAGEWLEECGRAEPGTEGRSTKVIGAFLPARSRVSSQPVARMSELRTKLAPAGVADEASGRVLVTDPFLAPAVRRGLVRVFPELGLRGTWEVFERIRVEAGRDEALEALGDEHAGFGALKALALVLPEPAADVLLDRLAAEATPGASTVATTAFYGHAPVHGPHLRTVTVALREAYATRPLSDLVEDAPHGLVVGDLLTETPTAAARLVGGAGSRVLEAVARDTKHLVAAAPNLAASEALRNPSFYEALEGAMAEGLGPLAALDTLEADHGEATRSLGELTATLGEAGVAVLVERLGHSTRRRDP